jgi:ribosomal protein S14
MNHHIQVNSISSRRAFVFFFGIVLLIPLSCDSASVDSAKSEGNDTNYSVIYRALVNIGDDRSEVFLEWRTQEGKGTSGWFKNDWSLTVQKKSGDNVYLRAVPRCARCGTKSSVTIQILINGQLWGEMASSSKEIRLETILP